MGVYTILVADRMICSVQCPLQVNWTLLVNHYILCGMKCETSLNCKSAQHDMFNAMLVTTSSCRWRELDVPVLLDSTLSFGHYTMLVIIELDRNIICRDQ